MDQTALVRLIESILDQSIEHPSRFDGHEESEIMADQFDLLRLHICKARHTLNHRHRLVH